MKRDYERRSVGAPFQDIGDQLDQPKPTAPADLLNAQNKADERANRTGIEAAVAAEAADREARRIPLD